MEEYEQNQTKDKSNTDEQNSKIAQHSIISPKELETLASQISILINQNIDSKITTIKDDILLSNKQTHEAIKNIADELNIVLKKIQDGVSPIAENNAKLEKVLVAIADEIKTAVKSNNESIVTIVEAIGKYEESTTEANKFDIFEGVNIDSIKNDMMNKYGSEVKEPKQESKNNNTTQKKGFMNFVKYIFGLGD